MTRSEKVIAFPPSKKSDWKARFERLYDQGYGTSLTFPFTCIREKQALLDLYEAVPELLKDYPWVVDKFFEDADIAFKVADEDIEEERLKNAAGAPNMLIQFKREGQK
jgi:hypothetical protein